MNRPEPKGPRSLQSDSARQRVGPAKGAQRQWLPSSREPEDIHEAADTALRTIAASGQAAAPDTARPGSNGPGHGPDTGGRTGTPAPCRDSRSPFPSSRSQSGEGSGPVRVITMVFLGAFQKQRVKVSPRHRVKKGSAAPSPDAGQPTARAAVQSEKETQRGPPSTRAHMLACLRT